MLAVACARSYHPSARTSRKMKAMRPAGDDPWNPVARAVTLPYALTGMLVPLDIRLRSRPAQSRPGHPGSTPAALKIAFGREHAHLAGERRGNPGPAAGTGFSSVGGGGNSPA